ncbi:MAG: dihydroneopterin aldolase [Paracoccaceae bacterium]|nr:dihydroneopterin aldolase [Paracoccaceae bacterium]MDG2259385.1 dihydroneopterin aldolase [Paracoccaceae bacterium]
MTTEIKQAFAHPDMRSRETASDPTLDRISVRDHVVDVEIGAFQVERDIKQRISFDIVVEVRPSTGAETDDVDDILSYDRVTEAISTELAFERLNLLETLAERIAGRILSEPQAERVFVRIEKLDRGVSKLGVEIVRAKGEELVSTASGDDLSIAVIHVHSIDDLQNKLDDILSLDCSVIVTAPNGLTEILSDAKAQLRFELLAIEQNALKISALNQKLVVVDTWTELDWGVKNGQTSVWAPSKIVLDSPDVAISGNSDALMLSTWLATELGATKHVSLNGGTNLSELE